jgi:hypothetical protein
VPIIPLYCDDYAFPDHDSIDVIESVWTEEQRSTLISFGTSMDDIKVRSLGEERRIKWIKIRTYQEEYSKQHIVQTFM